MVAVKKIDKRYFEEQQKELLRQEIQIMRGLRHPTIVELIEVTENERFIYLVMEYIDGLDLKKFKIRFSLNKYQIHKIMSSLFEGLAYLSDQGIIHRDIKP